jgi:hypothetical protein
VAEAKMSEKASIAEAELAAAASAEDKANRTSVVKKTIAPKFADILKSEDEEKGKEKEVMVKKRTPKRKKTEV